MALITEETERVDAPPRRGGGWLTLGFSRCGEEVGRIRELFIEAFCVTVLLITKS